MSQGSTGLAAVMRHLNSGHPSERYYVFFKELIAQAERITAANDRRHGSSHMSEWLSLRDLVQRTAKACPGALIPSKELVRLQFMPTNPYT